MKKISNKYMIFFLLGISVVLMACSNNEKSNEKTLLIYENNVLFKEFKHIFTSREPILCQVADLTNDGIEDMIIIYREKKDTRMTVAIGGKNEITFTEEVPAPVENQSIQLKDIDKKDEMEFIVRGSKHGNIGYAIFRIENMKIIDLFGEGMESCC